MSEYVIAKKRTTKSDAEGQIRLFQERGKHPILILDPYTKESKWLVALPKEE